MKNKVIPQKIINTIKAEKEKIAKSRDRLRAIYEDLDCFVRDVDEAELLLENAIDLISQSV